MIVGLIDQMKTTCFSSLATASYAPTPSEFDQHFEPRINLKARHHLDRGEPPIEPEKKQRSEIDFFYTCHKGAKFNLTKVKSFSFESNL